MQVSDGHGDDWSYRGGRRALVFDCIGQVDHDSALQSIWSTGGNDDAIQLWQIKERQSDEV